MELKVVSLIGLLIFVKDFAHIAVSAINEPESSGFNGVALPEPGVSYIDKRLEHNTTGNYTGMLESTPKPEENGTLESTAEPEPDEDTTGVNETATSEPEDGKAEPEKGKPEPEDAGPEPEAEDSFAEPSPEWEVAKMQWKAAWELHVYIFAGLFTVLGLYCLISVIRLWKIDHLLSRNYFISLNVLNITVCFLRSIYLFVDAYNSRGTFPAIVDYFLYSTVFPCLTALFSVLFYALLLATRTRIMSQKVQRLHVLVSIIAFHFLLSFITDIVVGLSSGAVVLIFICQLFYVVWGLMMFIGYVIIFKRMYHFVVKRQSEKKKRYASVSGGNSDKVPKQKQTLGLAIKITLASALFGLACVAFQLFGMFGVYGVIGDYTTPKPWAWWAYHSGLRLLEILMCFSIAVVSLQPLKFTYKDQKHQTVLCLLPCCLSCFDNKLDAVDSSFSMEPSVTSETKGLKT